MLVYSTMIYDAEIIKPHMHLPLDTLLPDTEEEKKEMLKDFGLKSGD